MYKKFTFLLHQSYTGGIDKSLARPGRKQARKHVRDARDFNNIETRAVIEFLFLQGKAPKEINSILTETLDCFLTGRANDLSAPLYKKYNLQQTTLFASQMTHHVRICNTLEYTHTLRYSYFICRLFQNYEYQIKQTQNNVAPGKVNINTTAHSYWTCRITKLTTGARFYTISLRWKNTTQHNTTQHNTIQYIIFPFRSLN